MASEKGTAINMFLSFIIPQFISKMPRGLKVPIKKLTHKINITLLMNVQGSDSKL